MEWVIRARNRSVAHKSPGKWGPASHILMCGTGAWKKGGVKSQMQWCHKCAVVKPWCGHCSRSNIEFSNSTSGHIIKFGSHRNTLCTRVSGLTVPKSKWQKQCKCHQQMRNWWIHASYTVRCYSAIVRSGVLIDAKTQRNLENVANETGQMEIDKYWLIPPTCDTTGKRMKGKNNGRDQGLGEMAGGGVAFGFQCFRRSGSGDGGCWWASRMTLNCTLINGWNGQLCVVAILPLIYESTLSPTQEHTLLDLRWLSD